MSKNESRRNALEGMAHRIAELVLRGDITAARHVAGDYALLRDDLPTSAEFLATVTA